MTQEVKLRRVQCNFRSENSRFLLDCDFSKQYCNYYNRRYERMRPFIEFNSQCKWDPSIPIYTISELASIYCQNHNADLGSFSFVRDCTNDASNSSFELTKRIRRHSTDTDVQSSLPLTSSQLLASPGETELFVCPKVPKITKIESREEVKIDPISSASTDPDKTPEAIESSKTSKGIPHCIIVGTIFKRMKLQPDVLQELNFGDFQINYERYLGHYVSQEDKLVLEDPDESIRLVGNIEAGKFVTGVVVGLLGKPINDLSEFQVEDICYAEPNRLYLYDDAIGTQVPRPLTPSKLIQDKSNNDPVYLMVLSGLEFNQDMGTESPTTKALQSVIDFIWGGGNYSEDPRSSQVARILVVGDNLLQDRLYHSQEPKSASQEDNLATKMKELRKLKPYPASMRAIKNMDNFFAQLAKTIDVDVMPGPSDPTTHLLPQQPFHPAMFPKSSIFSTYNCTTNPFHATYHDHVEVLATSGQNVDIISKFSGITDPIEIMKCHLKWGSSAPSAPDNLYSVPYENDDPFVIDFIPDIYIAGCQEYYGKDYYYYKDSDRRESEGEEAGTTSTRCNASATISNVDRGQGKDSRGESKTSTLILTIPKFSETFSAVLINLNNLECKLVTFCDFKSASSTG